MDESVGLRRFVHPTLVEEFGKGAIGHHKLQLHESGAFIVYFHDDGVGAVCVFGVVTKIRLTLFEAHTIVTGVCGDLVTDGGGDACEEQRKARYAVLGDVQALAFGHSIHQVGVNELRKILLALHISEPIVFRRAYVKDGGLRQRNCHLFKNEQNHKLLDFAVHLYGIF